jgi:poly-D-alanine transfer protein DltD
MRTLVVEYDNKKIEKQIADNQFGAYNYAYRKEIEKKYKERIGLSKEVEDLATELDTIFDSEKDAAINAARELTGKVSDYMKTVKIYMK